MNHAMMMRQAWHYMRTYRVLWVFGIVLALTATSWGGISLLDNEDREGWQLNLGIQPGDTLSDIGAKAVREIRRLSAIDETNRQLDEFFLDVFGIEVNADIGPYLLGLFAFVVAAYLLAKVASYIGAAALIRSVSLHEETGRKLSLSEAFRLGWSPAAARLLLIDLTLAALLFLVVALLLLLGIAPWMLWSLDSAAAGLTGMVASIGIFIMGALLILALLLALSLLKPVIWRACVLEELGVAASIRRSLSTLRQRFQDVSLTWLVSLAVQVSWPLLLAPLLLLLTAAAGALGGLAGLLTYSATQAAAGPTIPAFLAVGVGITLFIGVMIAPLLFLGGLREVFLSSLWTLTYRALRGLSPAPAAEARQDASGAAGAEVLAGT